MYVSMLFRARAFYFVTVHVTQFLLLPYCTILTSHLNNVSVQPLTSRHLAIVREEEDMLRVSGGKAIPVKFSKIILFLLLVIMRQCIDYQKQLVDYPGPINVQLTNSTSDIFMCWPLDM